MSGGLRRRTTGSLPGSLARADARRSGDASPQVGGPSGALRRLAVARVLRLADGRASGGFHRRRPTARPGARHRAAGARRSRVRRRRGPARPSRRSGAVPGRPARAVAGRRPRTTSRRRRRPRRRDRCAVLARPRPAAVRPRPELAEPLVPVGRGLLRGVFDAPAAARAVFGARRGRRRYDSPPLAPRPLGVPRPSATLNQPPALPPRTQTNEEGRSTSSGATLFKHVRRRPTLPRGPPRSTIGAEGLNFRVRNGTGCFPFAITAETLLRCHRPSSVKQACMATVSREPHSGRETSNGVEAKPLGLLVPVSCTRCRASTSGLSTQSSSWGPYLVNPEGDLILRRASRLDAFSGYPFRT